MRTNNLSFLLFLFAALVLFPDHVLHAATIRSIPEGKGSLPTRLFPDGTVCLVNEAKPSLCTKILVKIPRRIMKAHSVTFYGVFDLDGDGSPEIFLDYWSPLGPGNRDDDNVVLLVYKKIRGKYRQYLRLKAESIGYSPGAWFLDEPPNKKAVFLTRYGGSSGAGLFYLNLNKKSLDLISGPIFIEGNPEFLDMDMDGISEIFLPGRGRDRTSQPGAAILSWQGKDLGYKMLWPDWTGIPTVIYGTLTDVDGDGKKEIVAVLEPEAASSDRYVDGQAAPRELAVWKVTADDVSLVSKAKLPDAKHLSEPTFGRVPPFSSNVELQYVRTVGCAPQNGELTCREKN